MSYKLLTKTEHDVLEGTADVENPDAYVDNIRSRVRDRADTIRSELDLLYDTGHEDLVREIEGELSRAGRLERELADVREQLDGEN